MDSTWVVLAALALGAFLGAAFIMILLVAERRGRSAAQVATPRVPEGVDEVLAALGTAGIVIDSSNNVLKASSGAAALGLVRGISLVHSELNEIAGRVRSTGESVVSELTIPRGPFGERNLSINVRANRLGNRFVLFIAEDRTEAILLEEVRRDFIANISHELKTPIAAVGLLAEALDHAADDPGQVRCFAANLQQESGRLARVTQDLIELSRLQSQGLVASDELVDMQSVVATAVDQNRVTANSKNLEVVLRAAKKARVYGDQQLLITAVSNLIANAITYSEVGGRVGVGISLTEGAGKPTGTVEIAITDHGVGIPEDELDRVFERFYRVDDARSRDTGGTGLGLSIVKHIVQNHGGEVSVWSQQGHGSTFVIRLPAAVVPPPEVAVTAAEGA